MSLYQNADNPLIKPARLRSAAVLVPLIKHNDEWNLLYIRRTESKHDHHSGQVAFPGGSRDPEDDTLVATALRETREEIGIQAEQITIVDELRPYLTVSSFEVTPVVGIVEWPVSLALAPDEVARVFSIPLAWLKRRENLEVRERVGQGTSDRQAPAQHNTVIYFNEYDGEILWGATARMTLNFIKALEDKVIILPE